MLWKIISLSKFFTQIGGKYGKRAGLIRNEKIVENSSVIVAFWDGESKGTFHTIQLAKKFNKDIYIYNFRKGELSKHLNLF